MRVKVCLIVTPGIEATRLGNNLRQTIHSFAIPTCRPKTFIERSSRLLPCEESRETCSGMWAVCYPRLFLREENWKTEDITIEITVVVARWWQYFGEAGGNILVRPDVFHPSQSPQPAHDYLKHWLEINWKFTAQIHQRNATVYNNFVSKKLNCQFEVP